ncbi:hypothetical protein BN1708_020738, partial [Verticillium longisporum]
MRLPRRRLRSTRKLPTSWRSRLV